MKKLFAEYIANITCYCSSVNYENVLFLPLPNFAYFKYPKPTGN